jgi:hypothetical protein
LSSADKNSLHGCEPLQAMALHETLKRCPLGADGGHRAGVYACPAVDAGISSDSTLVACLADCVNRARIVTCAAVDAFVRNCMSQSIHLLQIHFAFEFAGKLSYPSQKVHHKAAAFSKALAEKILELVPTLLYYKKRFYL